MPDALVSCNQTWNGEQVANVLGFSNVQEDASWLQEFADDIRSEWDSNLGTTLSSDWSLDNISVSFISGGVITYSVDVAFTGGALSGSNNGDLSTNQTALLVSLNHIGPKPNRGRVYLCGYTEGELLNGTWIPGATSPSANLIAAFVNGVGPAGSLAFLRIVGRPAANGGLYVSNPVDNVIPRGRPATQRRRRLS